MKGRHMRQALLVGLALIAVQASAQHLSQAALDQISASAAAICGDFDREGFPSSAAANVAAEAELKGLIGQLMNLGVKSAGQIASQRYAGVLQDQLGDEIKDNRACRMKIWNDLITVLTVAPQPDEHAPEIGTRSALEEAGDDERRDYVLPGGVMSGSVVRGPLLYCLAYNSESKAIVVEEIQFGYTVASVIAIKGADVYDTVEVPCEQSCELAPGSGSTFDGPPNEPSLQEPTCSVRYRVK